jgi:hypothetical protein
VAVAAMGILGFGVAGAFLVGTTVATHARGGAETAAGALGVAQAIPGSLSANLHGHMAAKTTSTNWGGYVDSASAGTILEAYGEWQVPSIGCSVYPAIQDNWVGIDGFNSSTVEQGGTYGYCNSAGAGPYYWTWWEFFPYNGIQSVSSSVAAGNWIQAYILYNPYFCYSGTCGVYTITIDDLSNSAASFSVQGNPTTCDSTGCEGGSDVNAECISESLVDQGYYLPDYASTTFTTCDASINGYWSGIGGLPHGAGAVVFEVTTYGYLSGLKQQTISTLTTYDYKRDHFKITWKEYD